ncbi:Acetamidase/Formamidase [Pestalotiopsis sp. NC0098]|nr:Acetamidase/Formamidase [Pestalotiopsis sp. NC0098]
MSQPKSNVREIPTIISVDPTKPPLTEKNIHTRWHPEIPPVATIKSGDIFKVECMDFCGNAIANNDCADDIQNYNWHQDHHLSGPIRVETAEPGDVLVIDTYDIVPFPDRMWGFSAVAPGKGPLDNKDTRVAKSIWDFNGVKTSSRHVAGVEFAGRPHCGVFGTCPSYELMEEWNRREKVLNEREGHGEGSTFFAERPKEYGAYVGQDLPADLMARILKEGARTKPAREHGGNIDAGNLVAGSRIYLPVYIEGANLSVGDIHFSLGDGEPSCAIEMAGIATLKVEVIKNGVELFDMRAPIVTPSPTEVQYRNQVIFHGLSADPYGEQQKANATTSYMHAANSAMNYLGKLGYSHEQLQMLLAAAPIEAKILATPNYPHANVSVGIPVDIFEDDIRPSAKGLVKKDRGSCAYMTPEKEAEWKKTFRAPPNCYGTCEDKPLAARLK